MPISAKSARIGGASLIAVLMVAGGYVLPGLNAPKTKTVNAELTDELLATYVSKDTDADGLPDWQEVLYGTDSNVADTDGDGISDGEAVRRGLLTPTSLSSQIPQDPLGEEDIPGEAPAPGSLTERFSRTFLERVVEAGGGQAMTAEAQEALMQELLTEFRNQASKELGSSYTRLSVRTNPNISVQEYAASFEQIFKVNDVNLNGQNPLTFIQAFIERDDPAARQKLSELEKAYTTIAQQLLVIQVPPDLADEHLLVIRSFDSLGKATRAVLSYKEDPLSVMGALTLYVPESKNFLTGIQGMALALLAQGEPAAGMPGAYIVELARMAENL